MSEIKIPAVGESITEATIAEWTKQNGETVARDEIILILETDKASVEVVAEEAGTLNIMVEAGETVDIGATVGSITAGAAVAATPPTLPPTANATTIAPSTPDATIDATSIDATPIDIKIPAVGESITEATIAEWSKENGSVVERDEIILVLETDKASVEVVAETTGVLKIQTEAGETVAIGSVVGNITPTAGVTATPSPTAPTPTSVAPETTPSGSMNSTLSPAVQRIVATKGLDPATITGTGKHGQITKSDALGAQPSPPKTATPKATPAAAATKLPAATGTATEMVETRTPMTRLRQTIARRLTEAQQTAAILTTFNEIDMSAVMELRTRYKDSFQKKHDVKLGFMGFFIKAANEALKDFPAVNSSIDGTDVISRNYTNMGIAIGTDKGLFVPVIKQADQLSLADLEKSIIHYAQKAKAGRIAMDDLSGGTFTITNGGTYGSMMSTPILNPPQSGILGLHKIEQRPIAIDGQVVIRPMMYVALSYDHRIIDGSESVRFLVRIKECMEDPARMLLDI